METVNVDAIAERLASIGLGLDEARVYVHLQVLGASRAGDVAQSITQSRPKTYRLLESLVSKGYASSSIERPARFEAAPLEAVFGDLKRAVRARLAEIEAVEADLARRLESARGMRQPTTLRSKFSIIRGRDEITRMIQRLVEESAHVVDILFHHPAAAPLMLNFGMLERLAEKSKEGMRARLAIFVDDKNRSEIHRYGKIPNLEVRASNLDRTVALNLFDKKELVLIMNANLTSTPRAEDSIALWSDAREFVASQQVLFDVAWRDAKPL